MLIWTTHFSRKKAIASILLMGIVMAILICLASRRDTEAAAQPQLTDNTQRVAYLQSFGWEVESEPLESLQFLLPEVLEEPYISYNALQITQGFDLRSCCGKQLSRYTYAVTNYPDYSKGVQANLYLCENHPVAGDICYSGVNGFQKSLLYPDA